MIYSLEYYNEITIYIRESKDFKEKFTSLENFINLSNQVEEFENKCFTIKKNSKGENVLKIHFSKIIWNSDRNIAMFYKNILEKLNKEDYLYVRLGEHYSDYIIDGNYGTANPYISLKFNVDLKENNECN